MSCSLEPSHEVWAHGLLPLPPTADVSERALLGLLQDKPMSLYATPELAISLEQWVGLASKLGLARPHAAAVMRLVAALTAPGPLPAEGPCDILDAAGNPCVGERSFFARITLDRSCCCSLHLAACSPHCPSCTQHCPSAVR